MPRERATLGGANRATVRIPIPKEDPEVKQYAAMTTAWTRVSFFEPQGAMTSLFPLLWFEPGTHGGFNFQVPAAFYD